ncbi:MAG TPA: tetratricopeptide repeat protein [Candidatus Dormibacteraeota bacterium]|nr:tetratricopeptide repeat protein [Candidatus Dormibacteraeota bacterium]
MTGRRVVLLVVLVGTAYAQFESGSSNTVGRVRVRVEFANHAPCDSSTRIGLTGSAGFAFAESSVSGECVAEFFDVPAGRYRVTVMGSDVANADDGDIEINPVITQEFEVRARHTGASDAVHGGAAFVSASDLGAPSNAVKEFAKANRLITRQDWTKAADRLHKAVELYPNYAAAYNNLGAVYSHMGDTTRAREALQKAITLNDRLAPAYVNLGRVSFIAKDFPGVESLLNKALALAPPGADELSLLAYAQLTDQHLTQALDTSREGHAMQLSGHAFLHLVAARVYELQTRIGDSMAELQLYLSEEPAGPRAGEVKKALATFQGQAAAR